MIQVNLENAFDVIYGGHFTKVDDYHKGSTPVIKSQGTNNGVIGFFDIPPNHCGVITVARTGSVGACFYHDYPCYVTDDCMVVIPKQKISDKQMLVYTTYIGKTSNKYNYSRKVTPERLNKTKIPHLDQVNKLTESVDIPNEPSNESFSQEQIYLGEGIWEWFLYEEVFDIKGGYYNKKPEASVNGSIPFIGATEYNNGVTSWHDIKDIDTTSKTGSGKNHARKEKIFSGRKYITVSNNGSVGYAFYQPHDFTCTHDVNPITTKNIEINAYIAMFISTLVELERYRWAYGRKWRPIRMPMSKIKLPVDNNGEPDWQFMEDYIKSLPYSSNLQKAGTL